MSKYYFHMRDGDKFSHDDVGVELPTEAAAHEEAEMAAREMVAEMVISGARIAGQIFIVEDNRGYCLFELPFKGVLNIG